MNLLLESLSMTVTADDRRQRLPLNLYSFLLINHTKIENCLPLFTANTIIFTLLYRQDVTNTGNGK